MLPSKMYIYLENLSETEVPAEQGDICRCGDQILFIVHMHVGNTIYIQGYPTLGELKLNASFSHLLYTADSVINYGAAPALRVQSVLT